MSVDVESIPVVVIGGGQAGLAVSFHLRQRGIEHAVLEAAGRVGEVWRSRWDSLRLFTPAQYDGLPGMKFPAAAGSFPSKDEMAGYLESYVAAFQLPVRLGQRVERLGRVEDRFRIVAGGRPIDADEVVVATGAFQSPRVPAYASELEKDTFQVHAGGYRRPDQLREGPMLVVGAGNSGAEIAIEAARTGHRTYLAGRSTGQIPPAAYVFGGRIFWFVANRVLSVSTPIGRRVRPKAIAHGGPLIRLTMRDVLAAGVERVPRMTGVSNGAPLLEDGRVLQVASVVWCSGFGHDYSWIELPVFGADGLPRHERGVIPEQDGLYFVGLPFLSKLASAFIGGVGGDAGRVADVIARRQKVRDGRGAAAALTQPATS